MVCQKCNCKMDVVDTIQDYKRTARIYLCPICRDKEYTMETPMENGLWRDFTRKYRKDKVNGTGAYAVLRKKTIKQEETDNGKVD